MRQATMITIPATEAPIAAVAPVESPLFDTMVVVVVGTLLVGVVVGGVVVVVVPLYSYQLHAHWVGEEHTSTDEYPSLSILSNRVNENLCPSCGAVIFELMFIKLSGFRFRCHAVPFAAFIR